MTVLFNGRFSAGATFDDYNRVDLEPASADIPGLAAGRSGSYEYAADPANSSRTVARLTCVAASPGRCEIRPQSVDYSGSAPDWGTRWYAFWTYIPESFRQPPANGVDADVSTASNVRTIIAQMHETEDGGDTAHFPSLQLFVDISNRYKIILTYDENASTASRAPNVRTLNGWPIEFNRWVEWVFRYRYSSDTNGELDIYKDRRLQFSYTGRTGYNDTASPYFKGGLYAFSQASWTLTRSIYHDGIVIGDENSSYEEVTGHAALEEPTARGLV